MSLLRAFTIITLLFISSTSFAADPVTWPPTLRGVENNLATVDGADLLNTPESVITARKQQKAVAFTVAQRTPTVELAWHQNLGPDAINRRLWSSWGDICLARDGRVYCAIGDHGQDQAGDARCFIYRYDPQTKRLEQVVDMNQVEPPKTGQPAWSKVHAKLDEGADGRIYFSCTLNDGNRAKDPRYGFNDQFPGGRLYVYDPQSGRTEVFADLPKRRCTATSAYDRQRNTWWCNLEAGVGGDALFGLDLSTRKVVYQGKDGMVTFNRAFAIAYDGKIMFNGKSGLMRLDPRAKIVMSTPAKFPESPGMRCASRESQDGFIYGVTHKTNQLFRYSPRNDEVKLLGQTFLEGEYTTVCELSPDDKYLYYLPGSHGRAWNYGTPVIQYHIESGERKVLAFLAPAIERATDYVPGGTYGVKLTPDGSTLYVNFNGHAGDAIRPKVMKPNGFGLTAFAAIHIPESERQ